MHSILLHRTHGNEAFYEVSLFQNWKIGSKCGLGVSRKVCQAGHVTLWKMRDVYEFVYRKCQGQGCVYLTLHWNSDPWIR